MTGMGVTLEALAFNTIGAVDPTRYFDIPPADTNFDDIPGLQSTVDKWTSLYAATSEMHDTAAFDAVPGDKKMSARGIEVVVFASPAGVSGVR